MASRFLPASVPSCHKALKSAKFKYEATTDPADRPFSDTMKTMIDNQLMELEGEMSEAELAESNQIGATTAYDQGRGELEMWSSHFFQVFNFGIFRGRYTTAQRTFYGLAANQEHLPDLDDEANLEYWAAKIVSGDANRVAEGHEPMENPTAAEVATKLTNYDNLKGMQSTYKDAFQKEQKDVKDLLPDLKALVRDVWDHVEFHFRKLDKPALRRRAREWGVVYINRPGEPVEYFELPIPAGSTVNGEGVDLSSATEIIVETGATQVAVCRASDATAACDTTGPLLAANSISTIQVSDLSGTGGELNLTNANGSVAGFVKVTVVYGE